jgi:hypothetical protein
LSLDIKSADRLLLLLFFVSFKGLASGSDKYVSIIRLATSLRFLAFESLLFVVTTMVCVSNLFFSSIFNYIIIY